MHTVDGGWSDWIPGSCSVTCGSGTVWSTRECNNPKPANGGKNCVGDNQYVHQCYKGCCPGTNSPMGYCNYHYILPKPCIKETNYVV